MTDVVGRRVALLLGGLLTAVWPAGQAVGQIVVLDASASGRPAQAVYPEGALIASITAGDSLVARAAFDPNEVVDLIVTFESLPYGVAAAGQAGAAKSSRLAGAAAAMQRERQRLQADLAVLDAAAKRDGAPFDARPRFDYRTTLNGVALTTRRRAMPYLQALPYVRGVYRDREVRTLAGAAGSRGIRMGRLPPGPRATGRGVVVAILDTGVDYTHPDLGGGFGPGFKVMGGYDFVDDDADPFDENGHGTHVAGIAAAGGVTVRGVAPDARLLAVRVIGAEGTGSASAVLAGIEYAADPDGDPHTDDAVDVINLSLGAPGSPADPMSQAIDNAVLGGIVCVVAAGNELDYRTIRSPGTAAQAITVGASDEQGRVAHFSSRGPTNLAFTNKPDLVAPGVDINSTYPGGTYRRFRGTSMAAPQVAGAAALLLERHPDWTPALVKAALVQGATDLGADLWSQGGGRLDVEAAAARPALAAPTTISLGLLDLTRPTLTHTETLLLYNAAAQPQTFALSTRGLPAGVATTFSAPSVMVAPGGQAPVTFSITVNPAQVPFAPLLPPSFVGHVIAQSELGSVSIPITLIKTPHVALALDDGPPLYLLIHDDGDFVALYGRDELQGNTTVGLPLPAGSYDLIGLFTPLDPNPSRFYVAFDVQERVSVTQTTKTLMTWKHGENTLLYRLVDVDGNRMEPDYTFSRLIFGEEALTLGVGGTLKYDHVTIADVGSRYALNMAFHVVSHPSGADYVIPFSLGPGVSSSTTLGNDPAAFKRSEARFNPAPSVQEVLFAQGVYHTVLGSNPQRSFFFSEALRAHHRLAPPFRRTVYYGIGASRRSAYRFQGYQLFDAIAEDGVLPQGLSALALFDSIILELSPNVIVAHRSLGEETPLFTGRTLIEEIVGLAPPYWRGRFTNTAPGGPVDPLPGIALQLAPFAPYFANPGGDLQPGQVDIRVFADGALISETAHANLPTFASLKFRNLPVEPAYEAVFTFGPYQVRGVQGRATARSRFRLSERDGADTNPPTFENVRLTADDAPTDLFLPETRNEIRFTVRDVDARGGLAPVTSAALFYQRLGDGAAWTPLPLSRNQDLFTAAWPAVPEGYYSLRVLAHDQRGHTLEYAAEPALRFGRRTAEGNAPPASFALLAPEDGAFINPRAETLFFAWEPSSDADNDVLGYSLHLSGPGLDTTLTAGTHTALDFDGPALLQPGATYSWTVQASDGFAVVPASSAFLFHTDAATTDSEDAPDAPRAFALAPNYPNPFQDATTIAFDLPEARDVHLAVFDVLGRRVAVLADGLLPAGRHSATWRPPDVPSGVYLCRLTAGRLVQTRRMILIR